MSIFTMLFRNEELGEWKSLVNKVQDKETKKYLTNFVKNFYIPDNIDTKKFQGNTQVLQHTDRKLATQYISFDSRIEDFTPFATLSIDGLAGIGNRPLGYTDWFVVAYPDVITWAMNLDDSDFIKITGVKDPNNELEFYDKDKQFKPEILRKIINSFLDTKKILECRK